MGGAPSKMAPIRQRDALPSSGAISGFSPGDAQGCRKCDLVVAQGLSASGAKIYRELGTISAKECELFKSDAIRVVGLQMAFDEFKANLIAGKYFREQDNGFCAQLKFSSEDLQNVKDPNGIPWDKTKVPSIRKLTSGGGYSSITKLFIKPAIPFNLSFNGEPIQVNTMTLFHPCPIRIENVQYDAVLTLGDVADETAKTILMVPITGSLMPGKSGAFFSKIASFIPGILLPDPASGQYKQVDVPTGKDWNISSLFPASPRGIANVVDEPYYVWNQMPEMELYLKKVIQSPGSLPNIEEYGWKPRTGAAMRKFIMLAKPISVNTFDLQTIRMLPATPTEDAIPPPLMTSLVFKPCPPPATKEKFTTEKDDSCDPFAHMAQTTASKIDTSAIIAVLIGAITVVAVCIGIYFAMKYSGQPIGIKLKEWGEQFGSALSKLGRQVPAVPTVPTETTSPVPIEATTPFEVKNPMLKKPAPKRPGTPKSEPTLEVEEQQAKKEAAKKEADDKAKAEQQAKKEAEDKAKAEQQAKKEAEEKAKAEQQAKKEAEEKAKAEEAAKEAEAKRVFDAEQSKQKELEEKMKDTTLPEAEQQKIRKDYQRLTGEYHPTEQEQAAAAGIGLGPAPVKKRQIAMEVDEDAAKKLFEEEQAKQKATEDAAAKKAAEDAAKKLFEEEQAKNKAAEEAASKKAKETRLAAVKPPEVPVEKPRSIGIKNLGLRPRSASPQPTEPARPPFSPFAGPIKARKGEVPTVTKKQEKEAAKVFEEEKKKEEPKPKPPVLPPHLRGRSASPPTPPNMKPVIAKVKQEQKVEVNKVLQRIEDAKTKAQEDKAKKELEDLKEKQKARIEAAKMNYLRTYYKLPATATDRDLAEAQAKLRESVSMYRRGQQGRNILTGRGRTARN